MKLEWRYVAEHQEWQDGAIVTIGACWDTVFNFPDVHHGDCRIDVATGEITLLLPIGDTLTPDQLRAQIELNQAILAKYQEVKGT